VSAGYARDKLIHRSGRSEVWAGTRLVDGEPVVLKSYADGAEVGGAQRLQRELDVLRKVAGAGVPAGIELLHDDATTLVMARATGMRLRDVARATPLAPWAFLEVALQLASVLVRVHRAQLIHRDVHPGNVLADPQTFRTHLLDFGSSRPLGTAAHAAGKLSVSVQAGGMLAYIAPEQTGRMNRGIDSRSDLYSLGATLYFALTGTPPFATRDPLELIHAHIARQPDPACERRPDVPVVLSKIVQKLLQKEPEERYQTADGLAADLERCRKSLAADGHLDEFSLGAADAPLRPLFAAKLYGREDEVAALRAAHARAASGGAELVWLAGGPGVGKTAITQQLRCEVASTGGYLAWGKFDLYRRDTPYAGWIGAIQSFVDQVLMEPEARLAMWQRELRAALGGLAGALVELVPDLGIPLGDVPAAPALEPEAARARLELAVLRFLRAAATAQHPLTLLLDDLQWADAASLRLLDVVVGEVGLGHLLVIGAYRDDEVQDVHPLRALLAGGSDRAFHGTTIHVTPLGIEATTRMLADALNTAPERAKRLAESVARKTGSNPLLIQEFVLHMHALGFLRHTDTGSVDRSRSDPSRPDASRPDASRPDASRPDASRPDASRPDVSRPDASRPDASRPDVSRPDVSRPDVSRPDVSRPDPTQPDASGPDVSHPDASQLDANAAHRHHGDGAAWTWDDDAILAAAVPEGAVALLVAKLKRLEPHAREVLELASCIASEFDVTLLMELSGRAREELEPDLLALAQEGLLAPCARGLRFAHDRVREAAQSCIGGGTRSEIHGSIARELCARLAAGEQRERVFEIVDHLNRALDHLAPAERAIAIELNHVAGDRALASGAAATARTYFGVARRLLREPGAETKPRDRFELYLKSCESAIQCGELDEALQLLDRIDAPDLAPLDFAHVAVKRIRIHAVRDSLEDGLRYVLLALAKVGPRWPLHPSKGRLLWEIVSLYRKLRKPDLEIRMQRDPDPNRRRAQIMLIDQGGSIMARINAPLLALCTCWVLSGYVQHGYMVAPAFSLASYASFMALPVFGGRPAERLARISLAWADRISDPLHNARARMLIHGVLRPFVMRRRQALTPLTDVAEQMWEIGDHEYAYYATFFQTVYSALGGTPLPDALPALQHLALARQRSSHRYTDPERLGTMLGMLTDAKVARDPRRSMEAATAENDAWIEANRGCNEPCLRTTWMLVLCVYGCHDLAFAESEKIWARLFDSNPFVHVADHTFYRGLAAAALATEAKGRDRRRLGATLAKCHGRLRKWARHGPDFVHMAALLDAERARLKGKDAQARQRYSIAAKRASAHAYPHHAGLTYARLATLLDTSRRASEAEAARELAEAAYRAWGSIAR
jgi:hypothetical protein